MDHNHITHTDLEIYFKIFAHEGLENAHKKSVYDRVKNCDVCKGIFSYYESEVNKVEEPEEVVEEPGEFIFNTDKYRKKRRS